MRGVPRRHAAAGLYRSGSDYPAVWRQRHADRALEPPRRLLPSAAVWRHVRHGTPWSRLCQH
jgi:hypothetical protein